MVTKKECFNRLDDSLTDIHDLLIYCKYLPEKDYNSIISLCDDIKGVRSQLQEDINPVLIGLKEYTEGRVSWERAGRISDLHIFGLREYCNNKNVDWRNLRIDEYYGPTDASTIKKEWLKLDTDKEYSPIDYTSGHYMFRSDHEYSERNVNELYYTKECQFLIADFLLNIHESFNIFKDEGADIEGIINEFKEDFRLVRRFSEVFKIFNKDDYDYFIRVIDEANNLVDESVNKNDISYISKGIDVLKDNISNGCYFCNMKKK